MATFNPSVDAYITKSPEFAKPILTHLRQIVHRACPDVEEKMKWSFPHFDYKGEMMCSMASFKEHCAFGFWKASLLTDGKLMENAKSEISMGHFGRIESLKDLPPDSRIQSYIKEAMQLNEEGKKVIKKKPVTQKELIVPEHFLNEVKSNKEAFSTFEKFSTSRKMEYVDWINEAKTEATKNSRLQQAIEWLAEGKPRYWKYAAK